MWNDRNIWAAALQPPLLLTYLHLAGINPDLTGSVLCSTGAWRASSGCFQPKVRSGAATPKLPKPADNDERNLESRSSEQLLRKRNIWHQCRSGLAVENQCGLVLKLSLFPGFCCWVLKLPPKILFLVSEHVTHWSWREPVSFVMTPAHVLRLASTPEPEKVNPLALPWQSGEDSLGLPTVWMETYDQMFHSQLSNGLESNLYVFTGWMCWNQGGCLTWCLSWGMHLSHAYFHTDLT